MLILGAILSVLFGTPPSRLDFQAMTSPAYVAFADKADAICPARRLRYLHPADLDGIEEDFMMSIRRHERYRVRALNKDGKGCTGGGVSCPSQNMLSAISESGLFDSLVSFACASGI
ncbi:hypothetical protein [Sphingomonas sp. TREG-RG-20F-R18-01]|uniref:hypothetical protein n=1 Tax=Sphingomonas sp. TREG-RG-20F-R18-01 TaxID=2914982 RepID=UPI001F55DDC1|nr:hypothetical protein [Sphingomonas sp. TREG-RG-20F-R18-01]